MTDQEEVRPLAGLRVLEFGFGVAAPVACRNLAHFGADVIRVESARRPDSLRQVGAGWVPLDTDWRILRDTGSLLQFTCSGKRSIGLEIDQPEGRRIFEQLVRRSDALVMNMSVDAVAQLDVGYEEMRQLNPGIVWVNMPSFGAQEGPYRSFRTWGRNIAAMAGLTRLVGWPDRDAVGLGVNLPDYLSALWGTIGVVCAFIRRDITGEGCQVDLSQFQAAVSCIGPTVVEAALGGLGLGSLGNRFNGYAPHGVYPTRADEEWVAVSVLDDGMWRSLCQVRGLEGLGRDGRFETLAGRLQYQDDLDDRLSVWSRGLSAQEAAAELQAVGVAASPVLDNWGVLSDPHLQARDFFRVLPHARFGDELVYGQAIALSETPAAPTRAAPAFGQDTRAILRDVCAMRDEEIQAAIDSGQVHEMVHPEVHLERPYLHWIRSLLPLDWPASTQINPAQILFDRLSTRPDQP